MRGPYLLNEGGSVVVSASGNDPEGGKLTYRWDLDVDAFFETSGRNATVAAWELDGPATYEIGLHVTDPDGASSVADSSVSIMTLPLPPEIPPVGHMCCRGVVTCTVLRQAMLHEIVRGLHLLIGPELCKTLDTNFREFLLHTVP